MLAVKKVDSRGNRMAARWALKWVGQLGQQKVDMTAGPKARMKAD